MIGYQLWRIAKKALFYFYRNRAAAYALRHPDHLAACDLMVQPFPDRASTRRTSLLAQPAHGLPVITTTGPSTEPLLLTSKSIAAVPSGDLGGFLSRTMQLLGDPEGRASLAQAERDFYDEHFRVETIAHTLRRSYQQRDNT